MLIKMVCELVIMTSERLLNQVRTRSFYSLQRSSNLDI